jgi:hypothetical protein
MGMQAKSREKAHAKHGEGPNSVPTHNEVKACYGGTGLPRTSITALARVCRLTATAISTALPLGKSFRLNIKMRTTDIASARS